MKQNLGLILAMAGLALGARAATLTVGDKAPPLKVSKWVQGEPVKEFEKDKAYIVEFWATWCPPCRQSIPHLNEIHNKYKDKGLVVIGQDCLESDSPVAPFVKQMGQKMTYRVALDDKKDSEKGKMFDTWMTAAEQGGIPTAFVVAKTGEIAWIGHPMALKESVLEQVLDGNFDSKKAAAEYARKKEQEKKAMELWENYQNAMHEEQWDKAEGYLNEADKLAGEEFGDQLDMQRLRLNVKKNNTSDAETIAKRISEKQPNDAMAHNEIAWVLITQKNLPAKLIDVAEREATRANELAKGRDAEILDTVARVQFVKGQKDAAIATQKKAIDAAENDEVKKGLQATLDSYKAGKIPE